MVGHVDHGKTSLTKALTGKWTDTHSEELKRGISIRLGYADSNVYYCKKCDLYGNEEKCKGCGGKGEFKRRISFLDAPGHETLMTTVISASSIMDGALLLIAANEECPQPQTAEHLMVLNILGIKNIVVVQTKIDLVEKERAKEHYESIKEFLKGSVAGNAPIIPVVANYGVNINRVLRAVEESIPTPERDKGLPPRMYVSRSFDVNRPGAKIEKLKGGVLGGSLKQGTLKTGDVIVMRPGIEREEGPPREVECKVESLMCDAGPLKEAGPGGLIAIGTSLDPDITKADTMVGCTVGKRESLPEVASALQVEYSLLKREEFENKPLKVGEPIVANVNTTTTIGVVAQIKKGVATVKLKKPVCVGSGAIVALSRKVGQRWRLSGWGKTV